MAELSGSLASFGVAPVAQLLLSMGKTGDLLVARGPWVGQLSVERGRLVAAQIEDEIGLAALEIIATGLRDGEFEFSEGPPTSSARGDIGPDALAQLTRLADGPSAAWAWRVPSPTAVPRVVFTPDVDDTEIPLARGAIYVLLDVDGRHRVREIAARHGLLRTVKALSLLYERGLLEFDGVEPPSPPASTDAADADGRADRNGLRIGERLARFREGTANKRVRVAALELAQAAAFAGALTLGARTLVQNFRVEGISMQPNFAGGQVLVVNRAAYFHVDGTPLSSILPTTRQGTSSYVFGGPQRGDVAVFDAPIQPGTDYIKRVIGLPGDTVSIRSGRVYINGSALVEPYVQFPAEYNFPVDGSELVVPDDSYFVLGDNRPESLDSHFGWFVPVEDLIGRAWLRYWPPSELGVVQTARPQAGNAVAEAPAALKP